jgi:uncharacterized membrane protein
MSPSPYRPFLIAAIAAAAGYVSSLWLDPALATIVAANLFFVTYLVQKFSMVGKLTKDYLRHNAANGDAPLLTIFLITFAAVAVSMASLFIVINADARSAGQLALGLAAVPLGWVTIHLMAASHYAHLFWQPGPKDDQPRKGLEFPGTREPEGWDFIYFAFVIGMTAQTSDVQITGQHMRKFNLAHAVASFFFNTVLVAAAVNLAVAFGS